MTRYIAALVFAALAFTPAWSDVFIGLDLGVGDLDVDNVSVAPDFELTPVSDSARSLHATVG